VFLKSYIQILNAEGKFISSSSSRAAKKEPICFLEKSHDFHGKLDFLNFGKSKMEMKNTLRF
jgi:hypothetical protein